VKDFTNDLDQVVSQKEIGKSGNVLQACEGSDAVGFEGEILQLMKMLETRSLQSADEVVAKGKALEAAQLRKTFDAFDAVVFKRQFLQLQASFQTLKETTTNAFMNLNNLYSTILRTTIKGVMPY